MAIQGGNPWTESGLQAIRVVSTQYQSPSKGLFSCGFAIVRTSGFEAAITKPL
jgi:hypothetical protein